MKKYVLILYLPFLAACEKPVELKTYSLIIYGKESKGSDWIEPLEEDTIRVKNDTAAFQRGLQEFYSRLMLEEMTKYPMPKATSFDIIDESGEALSEKLDIAPVTDIRKHVKEHAAVLKSRRN